MTLSVSDNAHITLKNQLKYREFVDRKNQTNIRCRIHREWYIKPIHP